MHITHPQARCSFPMFHANPEAAVSIDMPAGPSEQLCVCLKVSEKLIPAEPLLCHWLDTQSP